MVQRKRGRTTAQVIADKEKEDKRKKRRERITKERIKVKDIKEEVPTERKFKEKKEIIQLNVKEKKVIKLGELTPEEFKRGQDIHQLKQIGKAALIGVGIGTAAFFAGGAILGISAAAKTSIAAKSIIGLTKLTGKAGNIIPGKFVTIRKITLPAARFATNTKSVGLTTSFLVKAGMTLSAAGLTIGIIGSYPFAGFIKEEALQTLSFAVKTAKNSGDFEGEQKAIDEINEILNPTVWDLLLGKVPFLNVHLQLKDFYLAAATKNANDQESLDRRKEEIGQPTTGEEIEIATEERRTQKIRDTRFNADYFALIREGKFEEAEELLQEQEATISVSS